MKLSKLYCNHKSFKNVDFNEGLNVIYADVETSDSDKQNSHNLGKTILGELIDLMLLKGVTQKSHFLTSTKNEHGKLVFQSYIFFLEIQLNSGKFLTIKRAVSSLTKISFKLSDVKSSGFVPPSEWDEDSLPFGKAKTALSEYLNFDFFRQKGYDYRKSISYSLRRQGDYADIYRLTKFTTGKHIDWKPFMFDLLGFQGNLLKHKYELDDEIEDIKEFIKKTKSEFAVKVDNRDDLVAQKQLKEKKAKEIEEQIDRFNFYEQDKRLISEGIETIESEISILNADVYNLEFDLDRLKKSVENNFAFDLKKVESVFAETKLYFPEELKKEYQQLLGFNKEMTLERNKFLKSTILKKKKELDEINTKLQEFHERKEKLLSFLQETDVFKRFKDYQKSLVQIEGQVSKLSDQIDVIDQLNRKEDEIRAKNTELDELAESIRKEHADTGSNVLYNLIRANFANYYMDVLGEDAYISWSINDSGNVEFHSPKVLSDTSTRTDTAQGSGYTYSKLFCVVFDLAIITAYSSESYYRFIYHDDVLANEDNGVKHRLLKLIDKLIKKYDIQYIFSVIRDDLPIDIDSKPIRFNKKDVVLNLSDKRPEDTLFGFTF